MRQIGDLLVWCAMVGILVAVVYFTPRLAQYMSTDSQPVSNAASDHSLALHLTPNADQAE